VSHPFQCRCGAFAGEISPGPVLHAVCYCRDCRAYAIHLGQQAALDGLGGTEVVATQARFVRFTRGTPRLACLSLSERGVLRWYAGCCRTPIANTTRDWRLPYVGFVHTCLQKPLESSFPSVQMHVNTKSAKGEVPVRRMQLFTLLGFMPRLLMARFTGSYRQTPFFTAEGTPVARVEVLTPAERERALAAT
jgi:hypothetical protein